MPTSAQRELDRIRAAHATVAKLTADDPVYAPIFARLEAELSIAEAAASNDPVARARAVVAQMATREMTSAR